MNYLFAPITLSYLSIVCDNWETHTKQEQYKQDEPSAVT